MQKKWHKSENDILSDDKNSVSEKQQVQIYHSMDSYYHSLGKGCVTVLLKWILQGKGAKFWKYLRVMPLFMHNMWTVFIIVTQDKMKYDRTLQNCTTWCIMTQRHGMLLLVNHTVDIKFEEENVLVSFTDLLAFIRIWSSEFDVHGLEHGSQCITHICILFLFGCHHMASVD